MSPPEVSISILETRTPPRLSIVIPAYNEERRLPRTLDRLHAYLQRQPYTWEIIVVSNASQDRTDEVVRERQGSIPNLQLLSLTGKGKGMAVRAGVLRSWGEVAFICDADLSMPPETLARFLEAIELVDVVVGSREATGARRFDEPWQRHFMGRAFNYVVKVVGVKGIKDTQCGFKAFRRDVARVLFGQQYVTGWGFDVEVLFLARKFGYAIAELPIDWYFDADSRVRPGVDTLNMVTEVCMIRLRSALRRYKGPGPTRAGREVSRGG